VEWRNNFVNIQPYTGEFILRAVTVADFIARWFGSRARRWNRRIASYATVSATLLSAKIGRQKTATVAVWSINGRIF